MLTVPAFANASVYVCAATGRACYFVSLHLSTWNLNPSLINVRGLRQTLHAAFCCDRHSFGPPVACGVRVGKMHDAGTKTVTHKTDLCHPHFVLGPFPFEGSAELGVNECGRDHPSVLELSIRRLKSLMVCHHLEVWT